MEKLNQRQASLSVTIFMLTLMGILITCKLGRDLFDDFYKAENLPMGVLFTFFGLLFLVIFLIFSLNLSFKLTEEHKKKERKKLVRKRVLTFALISASIIPLALISLIMRTVMPVQGFITIVSAILILFYMIALLLMEDQRKI